MSFYSPGFSSSQREIPDRQAFAAQHFKNAENFYFKKAIRVLG